MCKRRDEASDAVSASGKFINGLWKNDRDPEPPRQSFVLFRFASQRTQQLNLFVRRRHVQVIAPRSKAIKIWRNRHPLDPPVDPPVGLAS